MDCSVLEQNTSAYLTSIDQYELKIKHFISDFLKDPNKNCLLIEAEETRPVSLILVRVLKTIYDDPPPKDVDLHRFLGPNNQFYSEWQQLVQATSASPQLQKLRNLLVCEVTKIEHLEQQDAFFQKVKEVLKVAVRKKMIFISPSSGTMNSFIRSVAQISNKLKFGNDFGEWMSPDKKPVFDKTSLHNAALNGSIENVKSNLDNGVEINEPRSPDGRTALHIAVQNGHLYIVVHLVRHNANINIQDYDGDTPLHLATCGGQTDVVNTLLENKADLGIRNDNGRTVLHTAADRGNTELILLYIRHGAHIDDTDFDGYTPMHLAVLNGHNDAALALLLNEANVNVLGKDDASPLQCAVKTNNRLLVEKLLEHGAKISPRDKNELYSAIESANTEMVKLLLEHNILEVKAYEASLHLAVKKELLDIVNLLVNYGRSVNYKGFYGSTCLHYAVQKGNKELVSCLLHLGADKFALDSLKHSALHVAASEGSLDMCKLLAESGLSVRAKNSYGVSIIRDAIAVLHYSLERENKDLILWSLQHEENISSDDLNARARAAAFEGNLDLLDELLVNNENINAIDPDGYALLHYAVIAGNIEVISRLLIKYNANVNIQSYFYSTPLDLATARHYQDVVKTLLDFKADFRITNLLRETVLHTAAYIGNKELISLFIQSGADADQADKNGNTLLHLAVQNGHYDTTLALLLNGVKVNAVGEDGMTPLHCAVKCSNQSLVQALIQHGAEVHAKDNFGKSVLYYAVESANSETVTFLLQYNMHAGDQGTILLNLAARKGYLNIVQILTENGVSINDTLVNVDYTCLHYAVESGNKELVAWLLHRGAEKFTLDRNKRSAMHVAAEKGSLEICKLLDEAGLSVRSQDNSGTSVLNYAISSKNKDLILWLLRHEANISSDDLNASARPAAFQGDVHLLDKHLKNNDTINATDPNGFALMHYAVLGGKLNAISWLLRQKNIDIDVKSDKGETSTFMAFEEHPKIVKLLITKGANVNHVDFHKNTYLHYAAERGYTDIMLMLLRAGVDVNAVNARGNSALHTAVRANNIDAVKLLLDYKIDFNIKNHFQQTALSIAERFEKCEEIRTYFKTLGII